MVSALLFILVVVIGYLCGSVCSAIIVSQVFSLPDPRVEGSQNPGATNVLRLAGKKYAAIVLLADMLKGLLPVLLAQLLNAGPAACGFTCLAAVIGHMYPVFFGFKGGKGVATALGALLGLHFMMGVVVIATWLLIANFTRYSSLASMISITLAPLYSIISMRTLDTFPPLLFMALFILYQHRNNINRLIDGTEPKIRFEHHQISDVADELLTERSISPESREAGMVSVAENPTANVIEKPFILNENFQSVKTTNLQSEEPVSEEPVIENQPSKSAEIINEEQANKPEKGS